MGCHGSRSYTSNHKLEERQLYSHLCEKLWGKAVRRSDLYRGTFLIDRRRKMQSESCQLLCWIQIYWFIYFALIKVFSLHACYNLKCSCRHRKRPLPFFLACRTLRVFPLKVIMDAVHVENCVVCSVTFQTDDMLQMEHAYLKVRCKYISGLGLILKNTNKQTDFYCSKSQTVTSEDCTKYWMSF